MLVAIFGIIDIIAGIVLIFAGMSFPFFLLIILGLTMLAKSSIGFLKNFGSWIDFLAGLAFLFSAIISIPLIISIIIGLLVLQKGAASFFYHSR